MDIQVFFGLAVTVGTMLSKLNRRYLFDFIMTKTVATLKASGDCGICVFNNSQMIRSLKFQRGGHISDVSLMTSRLFLKARIPNLLSLLRWPDARVPLTCSNQRIPLPPGMPMYETIVHLNPTAFDGTTVCSTVMDTLGEHVEAWAQIALLSLQIYKFPRLLKLKDNDNFESQIDENIQCM